jgi:diguanylate cyclase (GGDEF)-like protein
VTSLPLSIKRVLRPDLLLLQAATVLVVSATMIGVVLVAMAYLEAHSDRAQRFSSAAILAGEVDAGVQSIVAIGSQDFAQDILANQGQSLSGVPLRQVLDVKDSLDAIQAKTLQLHDLVANDQTVALMTYARDANASFTSFVNSGNPDDFAALVASMGQLGRQAQAVKPVLLADAEQNQSGLRAATAVTRLTTVIAAAAMASAVLTVTVIIGRRLRRTALTAASERDNLARTTIAMERRNSQFRALYRVVTEVTDSMNTRYVVGTAIREAKALVAADAVDLRLLRNQELVPVGSERGEDADMPNLAPVPLGNGACGRAAKRGRTVRVNPESDREVSKGETVTGARSGIVLPLIVGARVVGTLACWSLNDDAFDEEDEQILEMMASQVATAVAAAESYEATEQLAHYDALTSLANRRQLSDDLDGYIADMVAQKRAFSMVMLDIDDFRHFNNEFGHQVGDITLQKVAQVLKTASRESDRIYRYGGEEFLAVLIDAPPRVGQRLAERLRKAVEDTPLTGENLAPIGPLTVSGGVSAFPDHGASAAEILERADLALLDAKKRGKNRVAIWRPEAELHNAA